MAYPEPIKKLKESFKNLPGVGNKTAERYIFHILKSGKKEAGELAVALKELLKEIESCEVCWDFSDQSPCKVCKNSNRDKSTICVVAQPQQKQAIEKVEDFQGVYHILRGTIESDKEENIKYLKVKELLKRIKNQDVEEVILALNHDMSGETTMMYIEKKIKKINPDITISRLARGLPMGSSLQYADEVTLGSALKNRIKKNKEG
ncbi:MAG: recombination mediator RecR [Candidatus Magasanikbacteria bacterium]